MRIRDRFDIFRPGLSLTCLGMLLAVLWLAGGASHAEVLGQAVVRAAAWVLVIVAILCGRRPAVGCAWPVVVLLAAAVMLAVAQIVPLPPPVWQSLPASGRLAGMMDWREAQPWRPWSMVPSATINALSSLIVPSATLLLHLGTRPAEQKWLLAMLFCLTIGSTLLGLLQFSGVTIGNPFINAAAGDVSGNFANRNHLALFVALGCAIAPSWAFYEGRWRSWRGPLALGAVPLFVLMVLAIGSRAGLLLAVVALGLGSVLVWRTLRREVGVAPRWVFTILGVATVGSIALLGWLSVWADRSETLRRVSDLDLTHDMRRRGLPTVLDMIERYFPFGSGFGGFDPVFRIDEPFAFLGSSYFNHAHNDLLEIILDAGVFGGLLLAVGLAWWAVASFQAWRAESNGRLMLSRLGSAMLLLIVIASMVDYPARTPLVMAIAMISATWLSGWRGEEAKPPRRRERPKSEFDRGSRHG